MSTEVKPREFTWEELAESQDFDHGTKFVLSSAYDALMKDARELREALNDWLLWEADQIEKEGGYVGKKINELIRNGNVRLALFDAKYPKAEGE